MAMYKTYAFNSEKDSSRDVEDAKTSKKKLLQNWISFLYFDEVLFNS